MKSASASLSQHCVRASHLYKGHHCDKCIVFQWRKRIKNITEDGPTISHYCIIGTPFTRPPLPLYTIYAFQWCKGIHNHEGHMSIPCIIKYDLRVLDISVVIYTYLRALDISVVIYTYLRALDISVVIYTYLRVLDISVVIYTYLRALDISVVIYSYLDLILSEINMR